MKEVVISALSGIVGMLLENVRKFIQDKRSQKKALAWLKPGILDIARFIIKDINNTSKIYNNKFTVPRIDETIFLENYNKNSLNVDTQRWYLDKSSITLISTLVLELEKLEYAWKAEEKKYLTAFYRGIDLLLTFGVYRNKFYY